LDFGLENMKKYLFLIILILFGAGAFIYFSRPAGSNLTDNEKTQALTKLLGRKVNLTDDKRSDATYEDKLLSFKYPGNAVIYEYRDPSVKANKSFLYTFSYDIKIPKTVFNYSAESRSEMQTLDDDSSYRLRTLPERGYQKSAYKLGGVEGVLFKKDDSTSSERSVFILHKNILYTFVFSGSDPETLDKVLTLLSSSAKFKDK